MNEKYAHPTSAAGRRRLARLKSYVEKLEQWQRSNDESDRRHKNISAIKWAIRMLEERFPAASAAKPNRQDPPAPAEEKGKT